MTSITRVLWILAAMVSSATVCYKTALAQEALAPDFTLKATPNGALLHLIAEPPVEHHFNLRAGAYWTANPVTERHVPAVASEARVELDVPIATASSFQVLIYICDNAGKFCERHGVQASWSRADSKLSIQSITGKKQVDNGFNLPASSPTASGPAQVGGFLIDQQKEAFEQASREGKPLLIDFFGIWCPPCNQLDEEVFASTEFQTKTSGFVRLKMDADSSQSWELKSKYHVRGYPTVIFANSKGDEISRVVGFRPRAEFLKQSDLAWKKREDGLEKLLARASQGDRAASDQAGITYLEREDFTTASQLLKGTKRCPEAFLASQVGMFQKKYETKEKGADSDFEKALKKAVSKFPRSPDSIDRRISLADLEESRGNKEGRTRYLTEAIAAAQELAHHPERLKGYDAAPADLWSTIGEIQERLGETAASTQAWRNAVAEYRLKAPGERERGYNLELAHALWKSGDIDGATVIYSKLESNYPEEFTFFYNHASMELALKRYPYALNHANQAFTHSYGDNKLKSARLLGKIYLALGLKPKGLEIVQKCLSESQVPADPTLGTYRLVSSLKELEKQLR